MEINSISKKQLFLLNWWANPKYKNKKAIIADGSVRTGKTLFMSASFVFWSMDSFNNTKFIMAGKTIASLQRNVILPMIDLLISLGYKVRQIKNENKIIISYGNTTNEYYMFGGQNEASQDLVQGLTVAGAYFDEVAIQTQSFVEQATLRSLTYSNRKNWFNCNPKGPYHWFKKEWIDNLKTQEAIRIHFNMHDNPILSDKDIEGIKSKYQGVFRQRFIEGKWVMAEGLVYPNFNKKTMVKDEPPLDQISQYYVSGDFGAQNPTAFILWGNYQGHWYALREYYYDGRHEQYEKSNSEYAHDLDEFLGELARKIAIILDPSAKAFAIDLQQLGYTVIPANNDVINGIREVQNAMNSGLIYYTPNMTNLFREKGSYAWDTKMADKGIDKVIKQHDHISDAERYFVMFILGKNRDSQNGGVQFAMR